MYTNGSEEFNRIVETPNNKAIQKRLVFEDTGVIIDKFKTLVMYSSSNSRELQIGTTNMSYLDVEAYTEVRVFDGQQLKLECGVELTDGTMEYAPMGVFTAVNVEKGLDSVKFTANDNMQKLEKLYTSSLTYPTTSDKIVNEICGICGIELATPIENTISVTEKLQGYTCREMIGFIAGAQGKFACFDRLGQLNLRWYSEIPIEKQNSLIWSFTKSQEPFIVDKIEIAKNTETKFTSGEGNNTIYHSNPLATQQITDNILDDLRGFSYSTSKIEMLDDIRLDIWDVIKVTYLDGNEYLIPCMSIRQNMGASSTYIESFSKSKIQNQYKYEGPTAQFINRMATELLITNRVVASKVDADYVQSHAITTDNLEAIKADIKYAVIEDLDADFITTNELEAESAKIKTAVVDELSVEFGDIKTLNAKVAKIDTLMFGSASGDVIQTTFANSVIAQLGDAQIKSAMIQDVSASKITAGTIYTNDVTIQSKNGQMMLKDNTIQISDGTRARVQIGKDASNDYSINVWDKSGNLMFSQGGITDKAIKSAIIRNDMVSENANINAGKLDISSLFTEINKSSNTIKANRIYLDEQKQTLEVSFKSMTTTVDGLKQTQSSQGTQLEVLNGQISSKIWKQDITTAVKDINIGGTNILRDTKTMTTKNGFVLASATITIEDDGSGYYIATLPADSKWDSVNFYLQQNMNDVIGKTATFSFDAKSDGLTLTTNQWTVVAAVFNKTNNRLKGTTIAYLHNADKFNVNEYVDGEWVRCRVTFVFPSTEEMTSYAEGEISKYGLQIFSSTDNDQYPLQIRKVKCEFGNKATDWTPAPEDTESDITSLTTKYSTLEQDVDSFKTTVSATYSTKTELQTTKSTLEQTINSFKTTVSETYTTLDDFNNLNVGGRNLLLNSKTFSKTTTQNQTNQAINIGNFSDYFMSERAVGKQITVSFDWTTTATSGKFQILFNNTPWATIFPNSTVTISSSNKSGRVEYTATLTDAAVNSSALYTGLRIRIDNIEGTTTVSNVKCEFGNKATDWTAAPEDMETVITSVQTVATQTANKFNWLVKSGTSATDFTLTDRMAKLTADIISLNGDVKVDGSMIIDGAITVDKIAANSITANKMAIGDFSNLAVINPDNYNPNNYTVDTDENGVKWFKFGSDTTLGYYSVYMNYLPANTVFNKGDKYIFRALVKASMVTSVGFRLRVFYSDGASPTYTNMASTFVDDLPTTQEYRQIQFTVNTLPTAGRPIKNIGLFLETRNTKLGTIYVRELTVHRMTNNVLIADGAITADKINVSDLFAQDIVASGSITSPVLKSSDYAYSSGDYSSAGMLVDLKNKLIRTPKVAIKPNGSIVAKDGTFTGTVNASEGKIGNITIQKDQGIYYSPTTDLGFGLWATTKHDNIAFHAGANNSNIGGAPFRIYHDGSVVAGDLTAGNVNLTGGKIGNWSITDGILIGTGNGRRMALYPNGQTFNINGTSTTDIFFLVVYGDGGKIFGLTINGVIKTING